MTTEKSRSIGLWIAAGIALVFGALTVNQRAKVTHLGGL